MTAKKKTGPDADKFRLQSSGYSTVKDDRKPECQSALFPEAARRMLNELQLKQTQLEMLNEELRRNQAAMEASQKRYFDFYNVAPVGFLTITTQGVIVEANLTIASMLGLPRESLVRQALFNFVFPEDQDDYLSHLMQIYETGALGACELRLVNTAVGPVWVRIEATVVRGAEEETFCRAVISDITERKLVEKAQHRSAGTQTVLREIADAATVSASLDELYAKVHQSVKRVLPAKNFYITLLDLATGQIERPYCVDETKTIPRQRTSKKGLSDYVMRERRAVCVMPEDLARLRESGEVLVRLVNYSRWAGAPLVDSEGKVFGVMALFSVAEEEQPFQPDDVEVLSIIAAQVSIAIERNRTDEALRESQFTYHALVQNSTAGIILRDYSGFIVYANNTFALMMQADDPAVLLGRIYLEFVHPEDREVSICRMESDITGIPSLLREHRLVGLEGRTIIVESTGVPITKGGHSFVMGVFHDITDRKRMEQELRLHASSLEKTVAQRTHELTELNEEMYAVNASLEEANRTLAVEIGARQQKEQDVLQREKQYRATTSLLTCPVEDVDGLLQSILQDAIQLVGAPGGHITLLDESGKNFVFRHTIGVNQEDYMMTQPVDRGMLGQVFKSAEILCVENYGVYPHRINKRLLETLTTALMMPLKLGGEVKGALTANWQYDVHPVTTEDVEIFRQFGVLASIALERTHSTMQITYQNRLLQGLAETTATLVNELDLDKVLQNILDQATSFMGIPHGFIQLFDADEPRACIKCGLGRYVGMVGHYMCFDGKGIFAEILRTGKMVVVEDYTNWPQRLKDSFTADITTAMQAPLNIAGETIGSIGLTAFGESMAIDRARFAVFEQFATVASIAVKNAQAHQNAKYLAFHDTLTDLPNRAALNVRLEEEMEKARSGESGGAVLFIDLDDLKTINDSFGHSCGDSVIKAAAKQICGTIGPEAFMSRVGGDEFVVILPGEISLKHIAIIADRLVSASHREYEVGGRNIHMSASIGVTIYPGDGDKAEEILKNADNAMYVAKAAGRNCWRFFKPEMLKDAYAKMVMTNDLRHALERGELYLHYQPQIALKSGEVVGFEALIRWNSREHGMVSPTRFIPLAEQSGLIHSIGQWVIEEACMFAKKLADMGRRQVHVAVNVSPRQLAADDFVEIVHQCINAAEINAEQLEVEITENVLIDSLEDSTQKLSALSILGVRLSLDDFGTGFSSLTYLRNLPVGTLKIDKSFIDRILEDKVQEGFVRSIIEMAHVLGLNVVAEGVETEPQLSKLAQFGCDCIQGYVYSKPVLQDEAIRFSVRS